MLFTDVIVRPSTTPASINVHGPWQIAPTGLRALKKIPHETDRFLVRAQRIGIEHATGQNECVVILRADIAKRMIDAYLAAFFHVFQTLNLARFERDHIDTCTRLLQRGFRRIQFGLFESVGRENGDGFSVELLSHDISIA
jgi:hypothetical protein